LPSFVQKSLEQINVPLGICAIKIGKFKIGFEICMELFAKQPMHARLYNNGCNVIVNQSGSEF